MVKMYCRTQGKTVKLMFLGGLIAAAFLVLTGCAIRMGVLELFDLVPPCVFHERTGYYCFGCGGTRAVYAFFQGRFADSVRFHPLVLYVFALYIWFMASNTMCIVSRNRIKPMRFHPWYLYAAAILILAQCTCKNILFYLYHYMLGNW